MKIKTKRIEVKWTQEQLAAKSTYSLSYIQKIENGTEGSVEAVSELLAIMKNGKKK